MAVLPDTLDSVGQDVSGATSINYTGITVANSGEVLLIGFFFEASNPTGITVVWDNGGTNQAMVQLLAFNSNTGSAHGYIYGLRNPTTGNKTARIAWTTAADCHVSAVACTGADLTSDATAFPTSNRNSAQGTSNAPAVTISSAVGNLCVNFMTVSDPGTATVNQTRFVTDTNTAIENLYGAYASGASSVTFTWALSGSFGWGTGAVDIGAASGGASLVTGWNPDATDVFFAKPIRQGLPPAIALTPATLPPRIAGMAWQDLPDRDRPARKVTNPDTPPAFGQAIAAPAANIAGMAWFEAPDRDRPRVKVSIGAPPAIALTPATLPPRVSGMAWFERPEAFAALLRRIANDPPPLPPPPAASGLVTWSFNSSDTVFLRDPPNDYPPAYVRAVTQLVPISGMAWFVPGEAGVSKRRAVFSDPAALAYILQSAIWSYSISEPSWPRKAPLDYAPAFGRPIVTATVGISGIGWFNPLDRDRPAVKVSVEAPPAIALTPLTLPPRVAGIAWFEPPDRDRPAIKSIVPDAGPAFGRAIGAAPNTNAGIPWFEPPDRDRPPVRLAMDFPPALGGAVPAGFIGMGWAAPFDGYRAVKVSIGAPPAHTVYQPSPSVGISGIAWAVQPDRQRPTTRVSVEAPPSLALTPSTLPPHVTGMGWFQIPPFQALAKIPYFDAAPGFAVLPWSVAIVIPPRTDRLSPRYSVRVSFEHRPAQRSHGRRNNMA